MTKLENKQKIIKKWEPKIIKASEYFDSSEWTIRNMHKMLNSFKKFQELKDSYKMICQYQKEAEKEYFKTFNVKPNTRMNEDIKTMYSFAKYLAKYYWNKELEKCPK